MVYLDPTYWTALSFPCSSVGRALHWYRKGHGLKSCTGHFFFSGKKILQKLENKTFQKKKWWKTELLGFEEVYSVAEKWKIFTS